jgi:ribosome biogenesis GTPase
VPPQKRLSSQQRRQISKNRKKKLVAIVLPDDSELDAAQTGLVTGRFGQHADVENTNGQRFRCHIRRTVGSVVCGDRVLFRPSKHSEKVGGVVEAVQDRESLLSRPDFHDGIKPVAANIDQIMIVSSVIPSLSTKMIDRYLVAAEETKIPAVIVVNKVELMSENEHAIAESLLAPYQEIGYPIFLVSCKTAQGLTQLANTLESKTSVFVGQSGVGKSSIINSLLPEANQAVGDLSMISGLGQHTTTASKLMHFEQGGNVIDSPGIREFALWHLPIEQIAHGFKEFREYLGGCKFKDCKHLDDPGCLIKEAVRQGKISQQRFESYRHIVTCMHEQAPSHAQAYS